MDQIVPSLTPIGLFFQAGPVVKTVLLALLAASVWCWVLIIEAVWCIRRLNRAVRAARVDALDPATELLDPIVAAGRRSAAQTIAGETVGEARTRVTDSMRRAAQSLLTRLEGGLPNLAVISSVAPFIGLITVARDAKFYVGRDEVARTELVAAVREKLGGDANRPIYVRGDREVSYGEVVSLMDQLARNGLAKISLVANATGATPLRAEQPAAPAR